MNERAAIVGMLTASIAGILLGMYVGHTDAPPPEVIIVTPPWAEPAPLTPTYEDERWQDPSGLPYCTYPDDGLRPCIEAQTQVVRP